MQKNKRRRGRGSTPRSVIKKRIDLAKVGPKLVAEVKQKVKAVMAKPEPKPKPVAKPKPVVKKEEPKIELATPKVEEKVVEESKTEE